MNGAIARCSGGRPSEVGEPLVGIGLPVYNGAKYLREAIESLLAQTWTPLQLVVSDNASTDETSDICRHFAKSDERVLYSRLETNIGGIANHRRVFELANGDYFMWASADDFWRPQYIAACIAVLRSDPTCVVAYSTNVVVDREGRHVRTVDDGLPLDEEDPARRFANLTDIYRTIEPFYGVIRRDAMWRTGLLPKHPGFDRILFAELALHGKIRKVAEPLYVRRRHAEQSVGTHPSLRARYRWIDPRRPRRIVFPHVEYVLWFALAAFRSSRSLATRLACARVLARWCIWHRRELLEDLRFVG
jgi:glycosyltransferase involved in cell wall biosynthesis